MATAPFYGYLKRNSDGSHAFPFVVCQNTIVEELKTNPTKPSLNRTEDEIIATIRAAVRTWKAEVVWNTGLGNIITDQPIFASDGCDNKTIPDRGNYEVKFMGSNGMRLAGCVDVIALPPFQPRDACWRSHAWQNDAINEIREGAILLWNNLGTDWHKTDTADGYRETCSDLHETTVHETGHAFGIGKWLNKHPYNEDDSIMSYDDGDHDCRPQPYDVVALMALYQSR